MPAKRLVITTYSCSIPSCEKTIQAYGDRPADDVLDNDWAIGEPIFGQDFDFCPDHYSDLQEWLGLDKIQRQDHDIAKRIEANGP